MHARAVVAQGVAQAILDFALILRAFHVDEVDHHQSAQVAQPQLACSLFSGFQVGTEGGFLNVMATCGARGVDVDGDQGLGMIDHDGAARWQIDRSRVRGFNLMLDLKAREQRCVVTIMLDDIDLARHHQRHKVLGLFVDISGIDQDFADFIVEVVAYGANHQVAFQINQERRGVEALALARDIALFIFSFLMLRHGRAVNGFPQLEQVVQVPFKLFSLASNGSGARDHTHAVG